MRPGKYKVTASCAAVDQDALFVIALGDRAIELRPPSTGAWEKFTESEAGTIDGLSLANRS